MLTWQGGRPWTSSLPVSTEFPTLPANVLLLTETMAVELATQDSGSFELAVTVLEAERPCEWYDLPGLTGRDAGIEELDLPDETRPAACVEVSEPSDKRLQKRKLSKLISQNRAEVS
jgi:hypothetical protein